MTAYTIEQLENMSDDTFHKAVTNDMHEASRSNSPFQSETIIERTMDALIEWLWITNSKIDDRAEDPNCPRSLYENTLKYRSHLLAVIDVTERRIARSRDGAYRAQKAWKQVLHEVVDAILEGRSDEDILAIEIPSFGSHEGGSLPLDEWWEIRLAKEPSRVKPWLELERNREKEAA